MPARLFYHCTAILMSLLSKEIKSPFNLCSIFSIVLDKQGRKTCEQTKAFFLII